MFRKAGWLAALAAMLMLVPGAPRAGAQAPEAPPPEAQPVDEEGLAMMGLQHLDRMAGELGLTDEQKKKLRGDLIERTRERIKLQGQLQLQRFELSVLLDDPRPDAAQVRQLGDQVQQTEAALARNRLDGILAMKSVLTAEQQEKLKTMRRGPRAGRPGKDGPGRGGPGQRGKGGPGGGPGGPGGQPDSGGPASGGPPPTE